MVIEVKLFRFSLPDVKEVLYLYSLRSDERYLRVQFEDQEGGELPYDLYARLYQEGKIERITSIEQVPTGESNSTHYNKDGDRGHIPYSSWDLSEFDLEINRFFDKAYIDKYYS